MLELKRQRRRGKSIVIEVVGYVMGPLLNYLYSSTTTWALEIDAFSPSFLFFFLIFLRKVNGFF